jgi:hypothetical protein
MEKPKTNVQHLSVKQTSSSKSYKRLLLARQGHQELFITIKKIVAEVDFGLNVYVTDQNFFTQLVYKRVEKILILYIHVQSALINIDDSRRHVKKVDIKWTGSQRLN